MAENELNKAETEPQEENEDEVFAEKFLKPRNPLPLLIAILVVILIAACVLIHIVRVTDEYEKTDYESVIELAGNKKELIKIARGHADSSISDYESRQEVFGYIENLIENATVTVEGKSPYAILLNGEKAFDVFRPEEEDVGLTISCCLGTDTYAEFPKGTEVKLNGKSLKRPETVPYVDLSEYELKYRDVYLSDRYHVGIMFNVPEWSAIFEGNDLEAPLLKDGVWYFSYPSSFTNDVTVCAPVGSEIIVNGMLVEDASTRSLTDYPGISRFEEGTEGVPISFCQNIGRFFEEPLIEVLYHGGRLEQKDGEYTYLLPDTEYLEPIIVVAPSEYIVRVNGVTLSTDEMSETGIKSVLIDDIIAENYEITLRPEYTEYTVSGLFCMPEITCFDRDGEKIPQDADLGNASKTVFSLYSDEPMPDADAITVYSFAKSYVKYVFSASNGISQNLKTLCGYIPGNASAYGKLREMYSDLYNSPIYKNIACGEAEYTDYINYGEGIYGVTVSFPFTAKREGVTLDFNIKMEILYAFQGKIRRILNYNVLSGAEG